MAGGALVSNTPLPPLLPLAGAGVLGLPELGGLPAGAGPEGPQVVQKAPWLLGLPGLAGGELLPPRPPPPPPPPTADSAPAAPGTALMTVAAALYSAGRWSAGTNEFTMLSICAPTGGPTSQALRTGTAGAGWPQGQHSRAAVNLHHANSLCQAARRTCRQLRKCPSGEMAPGAHIGQALLELPRLRQAQIRQHRQAQQRPAHPHPAGLLKQIAPSDTQ